MESFAIWRMEALALPALLSPCARCARAVPFACTERFRVNANGARLDVWLLYRCPACGAGRKWSVLRRAPLHEIPPAELAGYQADAPALVRRIAFAAGGGAEVDYRVVRPPLPESGVLRARIAEPEPCGVRWDRFLARELGWGRARVGRAAQAGRVRLAGDEALARPVADGDELALSLGG